MTEKLRIRVQAGSSAPQKSFTADSFQNFQARVGIGTDNLSSGSSYGFNPLTRNRMLLEWMYRGSWLVGQAVDVVAEDMTKAGITIQAGMEPDQIDKLRTAFQRLAVWEGLSDTVKWSRLYGGAIAVPLIEGQRLSTELRPQTIRKGQFKGLAVLDRWMVQPTLTDLVTTPGPDLGMPKFYEVINDGGALGRQKIHYSRVIRLDGVDLPYWQRIAENGWGLSVIERLYDRMVAFDSTTQGAAQLVFKAHLRTMKVDKLREVIAAGGKPLEGLVKQVEMIRLFQSNEGLTLIDGTDEFATHSYSFAGLSDLLLQFGEQLSGALQIPLVRLFGQSPAGLNSTGESDLKTYHDNIVRQQERKLRRGVSQLLDIMCRSELGMEPPEGLTYDFTPLSKLSEEEKANIADKLVAAVSEAEGSGIIDRPTAMKELRQSSRVTGLFTNITDKAIDEADSDPPPAAEGDPDIDLEAAAQVVKDKTEDSAAAFTLHGLAIVIETMRGDVREGPGWSVVMPDHYGYIVGTRSAEGAGEEMDCFVGPAVASRNVWVIDQLNLAGGFDEHKVMLGYTTQAAALDAYNRAFSDGLGWRRIGGVTMLDVADLAHWLETGRMDRPIAREAA